MSEEYLPSFVKYLLDPANHPGSVKEVQLIQTHISFVHVAGDYVYKWKKPVDFGFLDFSTLEKRKECCEQELILNRRLCPLIYLDLVTINKDKDKDSDNDQLSLGGPGEIVEYGIKMVRMPEEKMMGNVISAGKLSREELDRIIEVLVPFYEQAENGSKINAFGEADSVAVNVLENFAQTESFIGGGALEQSQFDQIKSYAKEFLADKGRFSKRVEAGKIRDCHGDLYSANICLADKVYVFDCIEFNQRFRYSDVAADVAFLAMDLDFHGLSGLSSYFIDRFVAKSNDPGLIEMLNFYKCYRAYVRGKIGLFTASDPAVDEKTVSNCTGQAKRYFQLAAQYVSEPSS